MQIDVVTTKRVVVQQEVEEVHNIQVENATLHFGIQLSKFHEPYEDASYYDRGHYTYTDIDTLSLEINGKVAPVNSNLELMMELKRRIDQHIGVLRKNSGVDSADSGTHYVDRITRSMHYKNQERKERGLPPMYVLSIWKDY